jgi:hypothetical protein
VERVFLILSVALGYPIAHEPEGHGIGYSVATPGARNYGSHNR